MRYPSEIKPVAAFLLMKVNPAPLSVLFTDKYSNVLSGNGYVHGTRASVCKIRVISTDANVIFHIQIMSDE